MLHTLNGLKMGRIRSVKALLALTYVILEGPTPRRRLAELLWPQASQPDSSLRVALHGLRSGKEKKEKLLDSEEPVSSSYGCDALTLLQLRGEAVLAAYPGPFLSSVPLEGVSTEFEEWVYAQRERLAAHVQAELLFSARQHPPMPAAALAEQAYRLAGTPPPTPERLTELLALSLPGSPLEAELKRELRGLEDIPQAPSTAPRARRLLGRDPELTQLLDWATGHQTGTQVALVSGMGGIGKSALTTSLLRELAAQGRGTTFVNAEPLRSAAEVLGAAGQARPGPPAPDLPGLAQHLGAGHVILLDGVDGMDDLGELLTEWTQAAPELRWVLTGRHVQLGLPGAPGHTERQTGQTTLPSGLPVLSIRLGGLPIPEAGDDLNELADNPAVQFLLREARRFQRDLELTPATAPHLGSLARRLQGHPMSMLLACGWLAVESLDAVHARVLHSLSGLHDRAEPARGLPQLARQTWSFLRPQTQRDLIRLTPFVDFDPVLMPAYGIPETSIDELLHLSLLEAHQPGSERLRLHPLVSDLASTELQGKALDRARAQHSAHYLAWFGQQPAAAPQVRDELANVMRASEHAARQGTLTAGDVNRLLSFFQASAQLSSGFEVMSTLAQLCFEARASAQVQAAVEIAQMWLAYQSGHLLDAQMLVTQFLNSELANEPMNRLKALNTLAGIRTSQGQWKAATALHEEALAVAESLNDTGRQAMQLMNLLPILIKDGNLERTRQLLPRAEKLTQDLNWTNLQHHLLWVYLELPEPNFREIIPRTQQLLKTAIDQGDALQAMWAEYYAARCLQGMGQQRAALERLHSLIEKAKTEEAFNIIVSCYILQTELLYAVGRSAQARRSALLALEQANKNNDFNDLVVIALTVARDLKQTNSVGLTRQLARIVNDTRTVQRDRQWAAALVEIPVEDASPLDPLELTGFLQAHLR
ncbi:hypothetical protein D3875_01495 [Deinococcus cavernae]|uniref:Uncharacterized protein n=1 Tax=Deinococcus cavernae TaxID=2320857 RepID=A0A418VGP3_9DEIO|nr:AAA family ATPase [Deinococcus cavernae]RJF75217.1 hypothetical protein D3875_01495 [Deinococcus cavernae]